MNDEDSPGLKIVFLREGKDRDIFLNVLDDRSQEKLVLLLEKKWKDFLLTYAAAERDRQFAGLLENLRFPCEKEFVVGWIVRWQIRPMSGVPFSPLPPRDAFLMQVLQLKRSLKPKSNARRRPE